MYKSGQPTTHSYVEHRKTRAVEFGILDPDDITKFSVANINSERIYNEVTLLPNLNAVNDPRMGTMSKDSKCLTCQGDMIDCPGHFGHIELACPVYHVGLID
jgi:DNA-directed RNA polymerase II subunit RPB1